MRLNDLSAIFFDLDGTLVPVGIGEPSGSDVHALLSFFRARGTHLAVVTNGRARTQLAKLRAAGLDTSFDRVWISQEVGAPKPRRWIFERALAAAACVPSRALFVGDDPIADIDGAARRGMRTCWVRSPRAAQEPLRVPDLVVGSLSELLGKMKAP